MFTLHINDPTFILGYGVDAGVLKMGKKAARPVSVLQDCISTFVRVKGLDVWNKTQSFPQPNQVSFSS